MIYRQGEDIWGKCDGCGCVIKSKSKYDKSYLTRVQFKSLNWLQRKVDGKWIHLCPVCAEYFISQECGAPLCADVVEVVRCKGCKHYTTDNGGGCNKENGGLMFATETDYCSYGERKETDD